MEGRFFMSLYGNISVGGCLDALRPRLRSAHYCCDCLVIRTCRCTMGAFVRGCVPASSSPAFAWPHPSRVAARAPPILRPTWCLAYSLCLDSTNLHIPHYPTFPPLPGTLHILDPPSHPPPPHMPGSTAVSPPPPNMQNPQMPMDLGHPASAELLQTQDIICELQDELRVMEDKVAEKDGQVELIINKNNKRERTLLECLEGLVGYTTMLEQNVFLPAVGNLLELLHQHHGGVAAKRSGAVDSISRIVTNGNSRLGKLLVHLHNPSANVLTMEDRRRANGEAESTVQPEEAYLLAASLVQDKNQMQQVMKFCLQSIQNGAPTVPEVTQDDTAFGSERQRKIIDRQNREISMLQQQSDSLKAEVQRLHATAQNGVGGDGSRMHQELSMLAHEKGIMAHQMGSLETTVRQERAILNQKIESLHNSLSQVTSERDTIKSSVEALERENAQSSRERHLLQQQNMSLDGAIQSLQQERNILARKLEQSDTKTLLLEQERAIVKQKFETIGKALSDGESEKASLKGELDSIRERLMSGLPLEGDGGSLLRGSSQDETNRLKMQIEMLQREGSSGGDMAAVQTDNLRLHNELERVRAACEQAKTRELDLHSQAAKLQETNARMKLEMDQLALARGGGGINDAGLPTGDGMHNRITAFEMSVNRLSSDVGNVQDKILNLPEGARSYSRSGAGVGGAGALPPAAAVQNTPQQHQYLQEKLDHERAAFEAERSECDEIVSQMTRELELLVQENQQLKRQQGGR